MRISDWSSDVCSSDLSLATDLRIAHDPRIPDAEVSLRSRSWRLSWRLVLEADSRSAQVCRSRCLHAYPNGPGRAQASDVGRHQHGDVRPGDRKSTRLNSSH